MTAIGITYHKPKHFMCAARIDSHTWINFDGLSGIKRRHLGSNIAPPPPETKATEEYVVYTCMTTVGKIVILLKV